MITLGLTPEEKAEVERKAQEELVGHQSNLILLTLIH